MWPFPDLCFLWKIIIKWNFTFWSFLNCLVCIYIKKKSDTFYISSAFSRNSLDIPDIRLEYLTIKKIANRVNQFVCNDTYKTKMQDFPPKTTCFCVMRALTDGTFCSVCKMERWSCEYISPLSSIGPLRGPPPFSKAPSPSVSFGKLALLPWPSEAVSVFSKNGDSAHHLEVRNVIKLEF